jgi:hypothetical protein
VGSENPKKATAADPIQADPMIPKNAYRCLQAAKVAAIATTAKIQHAARMYGICQAFSCAGGKGHR